MKYLKYLYFAWIGFCAFMTLGTIYEIANGEFYPHAVVPAVVYATSLVFFLLAILLEVIKSKIFNNPTSKESKLASNEV